jgi:hypothetical protein
METLNSELITNFWILFIFAIAIVIVKVSIPTISYYFRLSLIIVFIAMIVFSFKIFFLVGEVDPGNDEDAWRLVSLTLFLLLFSAYAIAGGIKGSFKTETIILSKVSGDSVGTMKYKLNWVDPFFEMLSPSIDLRKIQLRVASTPDLQTSSRGIKAKVKEISLMIQKKGDARKILKIEGGFETIKERILSSMDEFFIHRVGSLSPQDLDTDKAATIENMITDLTDELNHFCSNNNYPYKVKDILIGDTELDQVYYEALAEKVLTALREEAKDVSAAAIKNRIVDVGNTLLPNGTENEKVQAAQIALNIVKKTIEEKKFGVDMDLKVLIREIALLLKKRHS